MCPDVVDHAIAAKLRTMRIERLRSPIGAEHQNLLRPEPTLASYECRVGKQSERHAGAVQGAVDSV